MSLTYSFNSATDLLEKLKREVASFNEEVTGDKLFNLAITAYHITDWVKEDPSVPQAAKNDLHTMYGDAYLAICRDITNASKHYTLRSNYQNKVTDSVESKQGFGCGRFGAGGYGDGEEEIIIECTDGNVYNALDLAKNVLNSWMSFFTLHSI